MEGLAEPSSRAALRWLRRGRLDEGPERFQNLRRVADGEEGGGPVDDRSHGMQFELEAGHHAEVVAGAAHRPEEIGVLGLAGGAHLPVGGHDLDRFHVVDRRAVLAPQPAEAALQGQAADAGRGDDATGRGQSEHLGFSVEIAPGGAALDMGRAVGGLDQHRSHVGKIDHDAAVIGCQAGHVVASAADRKIEALLASEVHGGDHIGSAAAAGDQRRGAVDQAVAHHARVVVAGIARLDQCAAKTARQWGDGIRIETCECVHSYSLMSFPS